MANVQFRGADQVVTAYEANKVPAWAILVGGEIFMSYQGEDVTEGAQELENTLQMIKDGGGEGAYTLRVYKIKPGSDILANSPAFRGFKFNLFNDREQAGYQPLAVQRGHVNRELHERLERIEKFMDKMAADEDLEDEPKKEMSAMGSFMNGLLDMPGVREGIAARVIGFINPGASPAKVAGVDGAQTATPGASLLDASQVAKVNEALTILASLDRNLGDHLLKIAAIARDTPMKYKTYTTML